MKKLLLALAVMLAAVGIIAAVVVTRNRAQARAHPPAPKTSAHGAGIDREMTALKAMFAAAEGATPCETAWNAFKAGDEAGRAPGRVALVLKLAPHDEFIEHCRALPEGAQPCLAPLYSSHHREECLKARPPSAMVTPMFELKPLNGVQAGEQDADGQFMSTQRH